jgi:DNA-binding beta-propeller fold protein YncE
MMHPSKAVALVLPLCFACAPEAVPEEPETGVPILGDGAHELDALNLEELIVGNSSLSSPTDVAVHPSIPDQMWVTNQATNSILVVSNVGMETQNIKYAGAPGSNHFLAKPSALAFGDDTMATAHEEDQPTQGGATPSDFMGPTLWDDDPAYFDGGHATHLDMLHNSPNSTGIAWEQGNTFWINDGAHQALVRYDFQGDHGYGGADHSDGDVGRYVAGEIGYVRGVPSHMELDRDTGLLYVADTGNNRVAVLDINSGTKGAPTFPNYDGGEQYAVDGAELWTLVEGEANYMGRPAGLAIHDGMIFVGDHETGEIQAFNMDGEPLDYLDTGLAGSLGGIDFDADGRLYAIDMDGERVLRISVK